jgi:quercetin dioxygenase-like cupin family protein
LSGTASNVALAVNRHDEVVKNIVEMQSQKIPVTKHSSALSWLIRKPALQPAVLRPMEKGVLALRTILKTTLTLLCLMTAPLMGQEAKVTPLMSKDLADFPGKEGLMIMVEYPPGSADPIHRHNAHAFLYVLEGSIVMQVKGGEQVTLTAGQTFYEGPDDVHIVGHNASNTKPAKFIVFLVKNKDAPVLIPVK